MGIRRVGAVAVFVAALAAGSVTGAAPAFAAPPPSVSSVYPSSGPTAGKTQVTITGTAFVNVTGVLFGSMPAGLRAA